VLERRAAERLLGDDDPVAAPKMTLEDLLLRHGAVTAEQLEQAHAEQQSWGGEIGRTLVEMGIISEPLLMKAYAHLHGFPVSQPDREAIPKPVIDLVPVQVCEQLGIIPVGLDVARKTIRIATSRPTDKAHLAELTRATGSRVDVAAAAADAIERAIRRHYYGEGVAEPGSPPAPPNESAQDADSGAQFARMMHMEAALEALKAEVEQAGVRHPEFTSLMARVERLEQQMLEEGDTARAFVAVLIRRGIVSQDEVPPFWRPGTGKVALARLPLAKKPG
jgi:hypothetical protein